jgi:hypothetical protein
MVFRLATMTMRNPESFPRGPLVTCVKQPLLATRLHFPLESGGRRTYMEPTLSLQLRLR